LIKATHIDITTIPQRPITRQARFDGLKVTANILSLLAKDTDLNQSISNFFKDRFQDGLGSIKQGLAVRELDLGLN